MNYPIMFIDGENKTKLVPASIPYFLNSYERKISFSLKKCHSYNLYNLFAL